MSNKETDNKETDNSDYDLLSEISGNISAWYSANSINLQQSRIDNDFLFVTQWDAKERAEFDRVQKPMLTFNKVYDFYKKIVGEQRQNTPNLKVKCVDDDCSQEDMDLRDSMIRTIAFESRSHIVYQTAFENQLSGGFGAWRVITEYTSAKSFDQRILLRRINTPERTFFDPQSSEPTKHDGAYCGYYNVMSLKAFKKENPKIKQPESFPSQSEIKEFNWGTKDSITVVEYYKKEWFSFTVYKLSDGQTVTGKELKKLNEKYDDLESQLEDANIDPMSIPPLIRPTEVTKRESRDYKIMYYKAIHGQIIQREEWPGKEFPIIYIPGDTHVVDNQERTISFIRFVKDAQRFLNYCGSEIAQAIKNNRREQFIGTPDNMSGQGIHDMWKNPSIQQGILLANPDPITKQMPQRLHPQSLDAALLTQYQRAELDIQSILGFYEANRGASGQELSGTALQERQRTGNMSVAVFFDNLNRGIEQTGRVIMSMIPHIYDTERHMSLSNSSGESRDVTINERLPGGITKNDMTKGSYDVVLDAGPSFAVQRDQSLKILMQLVSVNPQVFPLTADLIAENIQIENTPRLVERLRTLVPPDILAKEAGQEPPPQQPDPQAIMMEKEMQLKEAELKNKEKKLQIDEEELEIKRRQQEIDAAKAMADIERIQTQEIVADTKAGAEMRKAELDANASMIQSLSKMVGAHSSVHKSHHDTINSVIELLGNNSQA